MLCTIDWPDGPKHIFRVHIHPPKRAGSDPLRLKLGLGIRLAHSLSSLIGLFYIEGERGEGRSDYGEGFRSFGILVFVHSG